MKPLRSFCTIVLLLAVGKAGAAPLKFCYEDVPQPPWTMPDGTGLNFALLQTAAQMTGDQLVFFAKPWKRCIEETRSGAMDGVVGAGDSPERRAFSLPPLLPDGRVNQEAALYLDSAHVYLRVGGAASWDGKTLVNPRGEVLAQRGYLVTQQLRAHGIKVDDSMKSAEDALRRMIAGLADVAVLQGDIARRLIRDDPRFHDKVSESGLLYTGFPVYLLVNRGSYAHEPQRFDALWNAIASARLSPAYIKLEAQAMAHP